MHGYARRTSGKEVVDDKFVHYSFDDVQTIKEHTPGGRSASERMRLLRGRVKLREMRTAREARKERQKACKREAEDLVKSFIRAVEAEEARMQEEEVDDTDSIEAIFWNNLDNKERVADRLAAIPERVEPFIRCQSRPSRFSRLAAGPERESITGARL